MEKLDSPIVVVVNVAVVVNVVFAAVLVAFSSLLEGNDR